LTQTTLSRQAGIRRMPNKAARRQRSERSQIAANKFFRVGSLVYQVTGLENFFNKKLASAVAATLA